MALASTGTVSDIQNDAQKRILKDDIFGDIVLNFIDSKGGYFFGELVRFEPGADLPLINVNGNSKSYNLTQSKAPDGHEPIRGILYFLIVKNHAVFFENNLSSARLEAYLTWLLKEKCQVVHKETQIILDANIQIHDSKTALAKIDTVSLTPPTINSKIDRYENRQLHEEVSPINARSVLKAANMTDDDIDNLMSDSTNLEVKIQIKFKTKSRKKQITAESASHIFRNISDDEIVLLGPNGKQKGRVVKLSEKASVRTQGSLLNRSHSAEVLHNTFNILRTNGSIDA